ncbi:MAG: hypothetical protein PHY64_07415 [Eubacteriales bacterium]|nr:hypothetical protein [Eubacteriales bacterium]
MKHFLIRNGIRLSAIFIAGVVIGYLLLVAVYLIPEDRIAENVTLSAATFDGSEDSLEARNHHVVKTYANTWLDNSSDSLILLMAAYRSDAPVWQRALLSEFSGDMDDNPYNLLRTYARDGQEGMGSTAYFRYWHGHQVFVKPLLLFCTYMDLRVINMLGQGALLLWVMMLMVKRGLSRYVPAFALAVAALTPWVLPLCLHYSACYYVMLLGAGALLQWPQGVSRRLGAAAYFMLLGMATDYFDLLSYPLITFGIPFVFWVLLADRQPGFGGGLSVGLLPRCGGAWLFGYAGMWAAKIVLVALLTAQPAWQVTWAQVTLRTVGDHLSPLDALLRNLRVFWRKPFKLAGLGIAAWAAVQAVRTWGRRQPVRAITVVLLAAAALLPPLWYVLIVNHSHVHFFFTHRILGVTVFALASLLTRYFQTQENKAKIR